MLNRKHVTDILGIEIPESVDIVAFQSFNKLTNAGDKKWTPDSGMLNISVQSCFNASRKTYAFITLPARATPAKPRRHSQGQTFLKHRRPVLPTEGLLWIPPS